MKLVIDIPEDVYTRLFDNGIQDNEIAIDDVCEMARALRLGTPLDRIRAEIDEIPLSEPMVSVDGLYCYGSKSITMGHFREKVFEIIDKYRTESENEE